jgi:hypothetical protein
MRKEKLLGLLVPIFLLFSLTQTCFCVPPFSYSSSNVDGWLVEANGGQWTETDGVFQLWCDGNDFKGVTLYKEIEPENNFTFSLQVKADSFEQSAGASGSDLQMGGIYVKADLPLGKNKHGFNFEYDFYNGGTFLLAGDYGGSWFGRDIASGAASVWYTMQLTLTSTPIAYLNWYTGQRETYNGMTVTASVFDENGHKLGSLSTTDLPFSINDIHYIGFTLWGHLATSYSFKNIQINNGQTPSGGDNASAPPSHISISAESLSTVAGSPVNVFGTLTDYNGSAFRNKTVVLSYIFPGIDSWVPISSGLTDEQGRYAIQWINSASGTFTLKAEWSGDETAAGTSNQTSLSFLPYQNQQQNFIFESNSTIYDLSFNSTSSSLTFNVTGPSGTTGYTRVTIAKSLLPDCQNLQASMDGKTLDYTVDSTENAWVFTFKYSHSTHQIALSLASTSVLSTILVFTACVIAIILCIVAVCVGLTFYAKKIRAVPK